MDDQLAASRVFQWADCSAFQRVECLAERLAAWKALLTVALMAATRAESLAGNWGAWWADLRACQWAGWWVVLMAEHWADWKAA